MIATASSLLALVLVTVPVLAQDAGVVADLNVYEGFSHGEYLKVFDSPESQQVYAELGAFLLQHLN